MVRKGTRTLKITTTYTISPNKVGWEFVATTDKPTIINITNHAYWNLDASMLSSTTRK